MGYFHSPLRILVLLDAAALARSPHSGLSRLKLRTPVVDSRNPGSLIPLGTGKPPEARARKSLHGMAETIPPLQ